MPKTIRAAGWCVCGGGEIVVIYSYCEIINHLSSIPDYANEMGPEYLRVNWLPGEPPNKSKLDFSASSQPRNRKKS